LILVRSPRWFLGAGVEGGTRNWSTWEIREILGLDEHAMKEIVISKGETSRVIRLGAVRYDWRVEKLVRELLKTLDVRDVKEWKARKENAIASARELGWEKNNLGNWERE